MARDYGKVRQQFWESDSLRELSVPAKFLALYLLTSPHTNAIGCFRLPIAYICHDTGLAGKSLEAALAELRSVNFAIPCERLPWNYIPNYLRHNPPENPNVWRKCVKELDGLPGEILAASRIAAELYDMAGEERMSKDGNKGRVTEEEKTRLKRFENGIETVGDGLTPYPCPLPEPIPEPCPNQSSAPAIAVVPPKPLVVSKLPDWLPLEAWSAYLEMRRKQHKAPTQQAVDMLLSKLDRWRLLGHDPTEILNYSTMNSYVGIFEPKADKNGQRQAKTARGHDSHFAAAASLIGEYLDDGRAGESDSDAAVGASGRPLLPP